MSARLSLATAILLFATATPAARAQSLPSRGSLPPPVEEVDATRTAMQALTRGQTSVTLAVATEPVAALQDRINRIHLRMNLLGWRFVDQGFVSGGPGHSVLLLSYQR